MDVASIILPPREAIAPELNAARGIGFNRFIYTIETLHGETRRPLQVLGEGWTPDYLPRWLDRIADDPLRRLVARGEVPLTNLPVAFENLGGSLSLPHQRRFSAGEVSLMRWSQAHGVRTGVSMAVRMPRGLYATINFYAEAQAAGVLASAVERLFLVGHRVHAKMERGLARGALRLDRFGLSARESECLEWIARGKTNAEIARILGLNPDTAKEYVQNLFRKLQVSSRAEAVARGFALGYLT